MARYKTILTDSGAILLTRAMAKDEMVNINSVQMGSGIYEGDQAKVRQIVTPVEVNAKMGERQFIEGKEDEPSLLKINIQTLNNGLTEATPIREIGLFVDTTLFAYAWLDGQDTDNILPPPLDINVADTMHMHELALFVTNQENASIQVSFAFDGFVSHGYLNERLANLDIGEIEKIGEELTEHVENAVVHISEEERQVLEDIVEGGGISLGDGSVTTNKLADGSVTTPKLADLAVTNAKIANGTIAGGKLASATVTQTQMANNSVGTNQIANLAVTGGKMANNTVTATQLAFIEELHSSVSIGSSATNSRSGIGNNLGVAIGFSASNFSRENNHAVAIGWNARNDGAGNTDSIAIGRSARNDGASNTGVAIGVQANVTNANSVVLTTTSASSTTANQVLLGATIHTPMAHRALSVISDERDKTDITPLTYNSLDFINAIEPCQYRLDFRADYTRQEEITKEEYENLDDYTKHHRVRDIPVYSINEQIEFIDYPLDDQEDTPEQFKTLIKSNVYKNREEAIQAFKTTYAANRDIEEPTEDFEGEGKKVKGHNHFSNHFDDIEQNIKKVRDMKLLRVFLPKDGSRTNKRLHNGVLAQQVKEVADKMGFDFAGFKDHAVNGGDDLYSITYEEFIAPLIGAVQQLTKRVQELENNKNNQ